MLLTQTAYQVPAVKYQLSTTSCAVMGETAWNPGFASGQCILLLIHLYINESLRPDTARFDSSRFHSARAKGAQFSQIALPVSA